MRRGLLSVAAVVTLTIAAMVLQARPASAHNTTTIFYGCVEEQAAFHVTPAGNLYETYRNVCVGLYSISTDHYTVEGVERLKCYRNAQIYDGCRWADSNTETQWATEGSGTWHIHSSVQWCYPCGTPGTTGYRTDSGRRWAGHLDDNEFMVTRGAGKGGAVRFLLADGSDVLKSMGNTWSNQYIGFD